MSAATAVARPLERADGAAADARAASAADSDSECSASSSQASATTTSAISGLSKMEQPHAFAADASSSDDDGEPRGVDAAEPPAGVQLPPNLKSICTIGAGSFGRVELVQQTQTRRYFALKKMAMRSIVDRGQVKHVFYEKRVLALIDHPFIVKLQETFKDDTSVYFLLEFCPGGDLYSYLRITTLPSYAAKFYAAQVVLALEYLHSLHIIYRDLKAENTLITADGRLKLSDFGLSKIVVHGKTYTLCGTIDHLAPEQLNRKGHDHMVDWYALGVFIYVLMAGDTPFTTVGEVQAAIQEPDGRVAWPRKTFSPNAKDLIGGLLRVDPSERLGVDSIKSHGWFASICWDDILAGNVQPPLRPTVYHDGDTGNFDVYASVAIEQPARQRDRDLFADW